MSGKKTVRPVIICQDSGSTGDVENQSSKSVNLTTTSTITTITTITKDI